MSLSRKIVKIRIHVNKIGLENSVFTETWSKQVIPDSVVKIQGVTQVIL